MTSGDSYRRLYCLVPDLDAAYTAARALGAAECEPRRLRVVVDRQIPVVGLREAGIRERTAIVDAARSGLMLGAIAGAITGLVGAVELPVSLVVAVSLVPLGGVAGSLFGAWISSIMGIDRPHPDISPYQKAIDDGCVLMLIDTDTTQQATLTALLREHVPDIRIETPDQAMSSP